LHTLFRMSFHGQCILLRMTQAMHVALGFVLFVSLCITHTYVGGLI
jgi:hypothetical protein